MFTPSMSCKILVGNKSDVAESKRAIPFAVGKALADEYNIQFFETSAKENRNVEEASYSANHPPSDVHHVSDPLSSWPFLQVFSAIARDVISRLQAEQSRQDLERGAASSPMKLTSSIDASRSKKKSGGGCC